MKKCQCKKSGFVKGFAQGKHRVGYVDANRLGRWHAGDRSPEVGFFFNLQTLGQLVFHQFLQTDRVQKLNHAHIQRRPQVMGHAARAFAQAVFLAAALGGIDGLVNRQDDVGYRDLRRAACQAIATARQIAHNELHGITPRSIVKEVRDLIDGVYSEKAGKEAEKLEREAMQRAQIGDMSEKDISREIKRLEKLMMEHARNLEFEKAAGVRDQLSVLKQKAFGAPGGDNLLPLALLGKSPGL